MGSVADFLSSVIEGKGFSDYVDVARALWTIVQFIF